MLPCECVNAVGDWCVAALDWKRQCSQERSLQLRRQATSCTISFIAAAVRHAQSGACSFQQVPAAAAQLPALLHICLCMPCPTAAQGRRPLIPPSMPFPSGRPAAPSTPTPNPHCCAGPPPAHPALHALLSGGQGSDGHAQVSLAACFERLFPLFDHCRYRCSLMPSRWSACSREAGCSHSAVAHNENTRAACAPPTVPLSRASRPPAH